MEKIQSSPEATKTEKPKNGTLEFSPHNREAMEITCKSVGKIIEGWGFKRVMGMIWAFIYLCPEAATSKDICKGLKISPALASITLQELIRWGVVHKKTNLGERQDHYIAEHDIWKMVRKVLEEREQRGIREVQKELKEAIQILSIKEKPHELIRNKRYTQFQKIRVEDLLKATNKADKLMKSFVDLGSLNISPLLAILKPQAKSSGRQP